MMSRASAFLIVFSFGRHCEYISERVLTGRRYEWHGSYGDIKAWSILAMHPILKNFLMLYHRSQPVKGPYGSARLLRTIELKHDSLMCRPWYDLVSNGK